MILAQLDWYKQRLNNFFFKYLTIIKHIIFNNNLQRKNYN